MKEIELSKLDMTLYYDKLKNGLEVYLLPYDNKNNYYMSYATRYGSETTTFVPAGEEKEVSVPLGIAHFLEHKMFEQEDGVDPFTYFSESGTGANAMTFFDYTQYICYGTKKFEDNLEYLIKYVNSPYYTDQNVEKEKGIIAEELKMYADIPDYQLDNYLRQNIYHNHPRRIDIGGSVEEIYKITKEDLYTCYNSFYSPNNMFILIVGGFDKDKAYEIIKNSLEDIDNRGKAKTSKISEPKEVRCEYQEVTSNISVPKIAIGLKICDKTLGKYDIFDLDLYIQMIASILFGNSSEFKERVRNKKLINNFYTEVETIDGFHTLYIMSGSEEPDVLIQEIKDELNNVKINKNDLERMKKVWIANEVKMIDDVDSTVNNLYDDIIRYKEVVGDKIDRIRNLDIDIMNEIVEKINFNNIAIVKMNKEENI